MNEFYLRELKEEEKVGTDNIYKRATAISILKNEKKKMLEQQLKRRYYELLFKCMNFIYN